MDREIADKKAHVRQMVTVLQGDLANITRLQDERTVPPEDVAAVEQAASPAFWERLRQGSAEPAGVPGEPHRPPGHRRRHVVPALRGDRSRRPSPSSFDRMKIVDGTAIPPGQARLPVRQVHLRGAGQAEDRAPPGQDQGSRWTTAEVTIATDPELQRFVRENSLQVREMLLQLDAPQDRAVPRASCRRSWRQRTADRTWPSCWRRSSRWTTPTSHAATTSSTTSWRPRWSCTGCASATP